MNEDRLNCLLNSVYDLTEVADLKRLNDGDLKHIGDAIIRGDKIETLFDESGWKIQDAFELCFCRPAHEYRVAQKEVSLGGIMIPKPVSEPLKCGDVYYYVFVGSGRFGIAYHYWRNDKFDQDLIDSNLIHLTKENTEKHADALNKLHQFELNNG